MTLGVMMLDVENSPNYAWFEMCPVEKISLYLRKLPPAKAAAIRWKAAEKFQRSGEKPYRYTWFARPERLRRLAMRRWPCVAWGGTAIFIVFYGRTACVREPEGLRKLMCSRCWKGRRIICVTREEDGGRITRRQRNVGTLCSPSFVAQRSIIGDFCLATGKMLVLARWCVGRPAFWSWWWLVWMRLLLSPTAPRLLFRSPFRAQQPSRCSSEQSSG